MQYTSNQDKSSEVLVMIFPRYLPRDVDDSTKNEYNNIAYMAPEIIFGGQRTPESDIYSFATVFEKLKIDEKDVYVNSQSLQSSSHTTISENGFKGLPEPKNATPEEQEEFHKELFKLNEDKVDPNLHPDDQDELEIPEQVHAGTTKSKPKTSFKSIKKLLKKKIFKLNTLWLYITKK
ncbi:uncharacterized protein OCT59_008526 [Rhizophagus irregularis]|uniref:uncharacterized protein n=1 Tax=Rhizophagus irregularis TaxID=588596 RepID=UPI003320936D|nr:hypothetical protein OCT59_008526 [Rhizophagus irregularis]